MAFGFMGSSKPAQLISDKSDKPFDKAVAATMKALQKPKFEKVKTGLPRMEKSDQNKFSRLEEVRKNKKRNCVFRSFMLYVQGYAGSSVPAC